MSGFDPLALRQWRFYVETFDDESFYLDAEGRETSYDEEAAFFVGDSVAAEAEGGRRSDLWEEASGGLVSKVVFESMGKVGGGDGGS